MPDQFIGLSIEATYPFMGVLQATKTPKDELFPPKLGAAGSAGGAPKQDFRPRISFLPKVGGGGKRRGRGRGRFPKLGAAGSGGGKFAHNWGLSLSAGGRLSSSEPPNPFQNLPRRLRHKIRLSSQQIFPVIRAPTGGDAVETCVFCAEDVEAAVADHRGVFRRDA